MTEAERKLLLLLAEERLDSLMWRKGVDIAGRIKAIHALLQDIKKEELDAAR